MLCTSENLFTNLSCLSDVLNNNTSHLDIDWKPKCENIKWRDKNFKLKKMLCCTAVWAEKPLTSFTELYPIGCIWPLVYFTDQLLAKQLTAGPHNKSLSSGILLGDLWASGCIVLCCVQPTHQFLKAVLRGKAMLYNGRFFHRGAPFIDSW